MLFWELLIDIVSYRNILSILACLLLITLSLVAQESEEEGGELESFEVIINLEPPPIVLPPARKGEVFDGKIYLLPPGDTLVFGDRITNLHGDGGALPVYGEFDDPLILNAEASIGTFISPRGRFGLEYAVDHWNGRAQLDLRSTSGHVNGAEASSLFFDGDLEYQIQGELPSPGKARVGLGMSLGSDSYTLYGNRASPFDRSRSIFGLDLGLTSETDVSFDYAINLIIESVALNDDTLGFTRDISAVTPMFGARFRLGNDSLNIGAGVYYQSTSLDYDTITKNPDFVEASGMVEWSPSQGIYVTAEGILSHGEFSDSGSSTLVMPRGGIRYEAGENLALFAQVAPELRAASYRSRIMKVPYVDREIALRPEKVLFNVSGGIRVGLGSVNLNGEVFFEKGENTPVVTLDGSAGKLRWDHVDSRTVGFHGGINAEIGEKIDLLGKLTFAKSVDEATDEHLPMRPSVEVRGRLDYELTDKLGLFGTLALIGEQNVTSDVAVLPDSLFQTIDAQFFLGVGGTYDLLENVSLFAEITNLLAQKYDRWQNYEAPGLELRVGARARL